PADSPGDGQRPDGWPRGLWRVRLPRDVQGPAGSGRAGRSDRTVGGGSSRAGATPPHERRYWGHLGRGGPFSVRPQTRWWSAARSDPRVSRTHIEVGHQSPPPNSSTAGWIAVIPRRSMVKESSILSL